MSTSKEKIEKAAITLFAQKGFNSVTTKEIAENAGVSEVTLFRLFENKRNLYQGLIRENMHPYKIEQYLDTQATYDLQTDLTAIANLMSSTLKENLPFIKMIVKDHGPQKTHGPGGNHDNKAKKALVNYLKLMQKKGVMKESPEYVARLFMSNMFSVYHEAIFRPGAEFNQKYFDWMIKKIIDAIKS